jgi:hypothetical protein
MFTGELFGYRLAPMLVFRLRQTFSGGSDVVMTEQKSVDSCECSTFLYTFFGSATTLHEVHVHYGKCSWLILDSGRSS